VEAELSSSGLVVVLVSLPQQTMHVYRNGISIGRSPGTTVIVHGSAGRAEANL